MPRHAQIQQLISRIKSKDEVLYQILNGLNLDSRDNSQTTINISQGVDQAVVDLSGLQAAIDALELAITNLATQAALDALTATFNNHKNRHTSGNADSFVAADVIDALVKRIRSITADLEIGTIVDGEFLKRVGTTIVSAAGTSSPPVSTDPHWEPITNGDPITPEILFDGVTGDVLMNWVT
jgi:hypothetical protein